MSTSSDPRWIGWQKQLECPCVPMEVGGGLPPDMNRLTSIFGRVDVSLRALADIRERPLSPSTAAFIGSPVKPGDVRHKGSRVRGGGKSTISFHVSP